jgi:hypothetical protein
VSVHHFTAIVMKLIVLISHLVLVLVLVSGDRD